MRTFIGSDKNRKGGALAVFAVVMLVGCSAAGASPNTSAEASASPSAVASSVASASPVPTATTAPTAKTWTSVAWQKLSAQQLPAGLASDSSDGIWRSVYGWSGGYVVFDINADSGAVRVYSGSDGIHWTRGADFAMATDNGTFLGGSIGDVLEGPAGLLALGYGPRATCGVNLPRVDQLWSSQDGLSWTPIDLTKAFGSAWITAVSGGSTGFIATGVSGDIYKGVGSAWTSADGVTWHKVALSQTAFKNGVIQNPAAFAGGFVITGFSWADSEGCGGPSQVHPTTWWSAGGATWTKVQLPGAATGTSVAMSLVRVTDRVLIAGASTWKGSGDPTDQAWMTRDGQTWTPLLNAHMGDTIVTDGTRAFSVDCPRRGGCGIDKKSAPVIQAVDDNLALTPVAQTGPTPPFLDTGNYYYGWDMAVGPGGFLVTDVNGALWLGTPSAA
jgi:hypothetical protein